MATDSSHSGGTTSSASWSSREIAGGSAGWIDAEAEDSGVTDSEEVDCGTVESAVRISENSRARIENRCEGEIESRMGGSIHTVQLQPVNSFEMAHIQCRDPKVVTSCRRRNEYISVFDNLVSCFQFSKYGRGSISNIIIKVD